MSVADASRCRLCLVTPIGFDAPSFAPLLADALAGGDVASLVIAAPAEPAGLQRAAELLVPIAQARGVAALIVNDVEIARRTNADGVHAESGPAQLAATLNALRGKIVGAGNIRTRHDAMLAGEAEPDYLFFGRLDGDGGELIFDKALDLASWWASMGLIPAVVMGGRSIASVNQAVETRIEFVALSRAVWEHPAGPAAAVAEANRFLGAVVEPAA